MDTNTRFWFWDFGCMKNIPSFKQCRQPRLGGPERTGWTWRPILGWLGPDWAWGSISACIRRKVRIAKLEKSCEKAKEGFRE